MCSIERIRVSNKKTFVHKKMSFNSKNIRAVTELFHVEVDQSFPKLCAQKSCASS